MGNSASETIESTDIGLNQPDHCFVNSRREKKMRLLCMHGWRTSGNILMMQCAALRYHSQFEMAVVNAPFLADGPPDPMIGQIYSNVPYYQWYYRYDEADSVRFEGIEESINYVINQIEETGPYDGILGFSQGAAITTMVIAVILKRQQNDASNIISPKFAVLIGGIQPMEQFFPKEPLDIPSLHILGRADHLLHRSEALITCYASDGEKEIIKNATDGTISEITEGKRTVLYHNEGHQIPSMRTGLYPRIKAWLESQS